MRPTDEEYEAGAMAYEDELVAKGEAIWMKCMYCKKPKLLSMKSLEAQGILNYFCDGDCEDRFAISL